VHALVDLIAAVGVVMFALAATVVVATALWMRGRRRAARRHVDRTLDRLAGQIAQRLASGDAPGWALVRYERLSDDVQRARTWRALQQLVWRERVLDEAEHAVRRVPMLVSRWRRSRQSADRVDAARP
jgi:hypothetical protein